MLSPSLRRLKSFASHMQEGLSEAEAKTRLVKYGRNELVERSRPGFFRMLLDQFNNFLVIILILAAVISLFLGEVVDASAIMAIVVLNAVLGVIRELKLNRRWLP